MLNFKTLKNKFEFQIINSDKLNLNSINNNEIKGVDFLTHLYQLWKADVKFQDNVVIVDNDVILKIFFKDIPTEELKSFVDFLTKNNSIYFMINEKQSEKMLLNNQIFIENVSNLVFINSKFSPEILFATLVSYIYRRNATIERVHGSLMTIFGEGVIIIGESGIGKSELVLNLLDRNHLFVADDALDIIEFAGELFGTGAEVIKNFLEIRGIGIIDIKRAKGIESIVNSTKISLILNLKYLDEVKDSIDRIGNDVEYTKIHNTEIPTMIIPVSQGRNLASIVEMAVVVHKMKKYDHYDLLYELKKMRE